MYLTTLADPARIQQIALLCGTVRPFRTHSLVVDEGGKTWACVRLNGQMFAVPLARLETGLSFGPIAERVLWIVHYKARTDRTVQIGFSSEELRRLIWGAKWPRNWHISLVRTFRSLADLRVGEWPSAVPNPPLGNTRPLFTRINEADGRTVFVIGDGFLGSLEQFAVQDNDGQTYTFPSGKRLKKLRVEQRVQDVYLPIYLGDFSTCKRFSSRQKRLLQAIINEVTCPARARDAGSAESTSRSLESAEVITSVRVAGYNGRGLADCPSLDPLVHHIGFNGNGVRRGHGYKLDTWLAKAGYGEAELQAFLNDLSFLGQALGIIVTAIGKGPNPWRSLFQIRQMAADGHRGRRKLDGFHVRIYARADCVERWNQFFQWTCTADEGEDASGQALPDALEELRGIMRTDQLTQIRLAQRFAVSKQFLNAVLHGRKRCPDWLTRRIRHFVSMQQKADTKKTDSPVKPPTFELIAVQIKQGSSAMRKAALDYHDRGWAVIPIRSWEYPRKPFVKWAVYEDKRPTRECVADWWKKWPDAGIAAVLGPVSGLLCGDVDGELPYRILLDLLGEIPAAPIVKSGGEDPFRFHMYFRHPAVRSRAKLTPWNKPDDPEKLELRGYKGLAVLPPSLHKSGRRYAWVKGRHIDDLALPELPDALLEGLEAAMAASKYVAESLGPPDAPIGLVAGGKTSFCGYELAPSTARFLSGKHAESGGWNSRLFRASCDLHGRGVPQAKAEALLLAGAKPRTSDDVIVARDTIASAYSQPRSPSRY